MAKSNNIDKRLVELLSERARDYIEKLKSEFSSTGGYAPELRSQLLREIETINKGPLSDSVIKLIYNELLSGAMTVVTKPSVAYLGPEGTYSNKAVTEFFGSFIDGLPTKTISDVFREVESGNATYGVVPVENSTEGSVNFTLDELIETDLSIIAEKFVRISCSLLSARSDMKEIKRLYTHPQPLGQCKEWLKKNLPSPEILHVDSTTRAAELAAEDDEAGALASELAADLYGLNVLVKSIEDSRQNYTRFFVIGRDKTKTTGKDKTSIVFSIKDRPGALLVILTHFHKAEINMTKIESRPDKKKMWEYNFFIDFQGHREDRKVAEVLAKIKKDSLFLKILGSYPVGN